MIPVVLALVLLAVRVVREVRCLRCGNRWFPRSPDPPKVCWRCKSPSWNEPRLTERQLKVLRPKWGAAGREKQLKGVKP